MEILDISAFQDSGDGGPSRELVMGGGLEGAQRTSRETALWNPVSGSPDQAINSVKQMADDRAKDMVMNDGYSAGGVAIHKDSIVGANYRLVARPNYRVVGSDEVWAEEFSAEAESKFNLAADSESCWFDASRETTFTGLMRLAVGVYVYTGEVLGTAEWIRESDRPFKTALQMVSSDRLCNPDGVMDTRNLRRGVVKDDRGKATAYWIRKGYESEWYDNRSQEWSLIPAEKPWGRKQVIFLKEAQQIDQTRGVAEMVAALKHCRMTKQFSEIVLQNAVINASYAAAIESELPSAEVVAAMGGGEAGYTSAIGNYMTMLQQYLGEANAISIDGARIPHFFPGTKLSMKPMGTPGGVGSEFEASLLRKVAASLGVSYAELSRDFTKQSYSAARAEMATTGRTMGARKKMVADRLATNVYQLWVEEMLAQGELPLPARRNRTDFYRPYMKEAYTRCSWIGTGKGQIDEMKETQAAMMRIKAGLSTWEIECARLGLDWREVFEGQARQKALADKLGLTFVMDSTKPAGNDAKQIMEDKQADSAQDIEDDPALETEEEA